MSDQLMLYYSNRILLIKLLAFLIFGTIGFWGFVDTREVGLLVLGIVCGTMVFDSAKKMLDSSVRIIVDSNAITVFGPKRNKIIPWENVDRIWIKRMRYRQAICFAFKDRDKFFQDSPLIEKKLFAVDKWIGTGHYSLSFDSLNRDVNGVWDFINMLNSSNQISIKMGL